MMILERETQDVHSRRSSIEPCEARRWYRLPREKPRRGAFKVIDARCRQAGQDTTIRKSAKSPLHSLHNHGYLQNRATESVERKLSDLPKQNHLLYFIVASDPWKSTDRAARPFQNRWTLWDGEQKLRTNTCITRLLNGIQNEQYHDINKRKKMLQYI